MKNILLSLFCFFVTSVMARISPLTPEGSRETLRLAADGRFLYTIVYKDGDENAHEAACELRAFLKLMAGNVLPAMQTDREALEAGVPFISVGMTSHAQAAGMGKQVEAGRASAEIRVKDGNLFLFGNVNAFDAVMAFLEEDCGCRFFTAEILKYPVAMPLDISVVSRHETADITRRLILTDYALVLKPHWAMHNRVKTWEHFDHPRDFFCHTYNKIVPMEDFAKTPELFALVNGKPSNTMICPTHPETIRRAIALTRSYMAANPGKRLFSIAENDGGYPCCQCERCMEIIQKYDAPIAPHLTLVNEVARAVKDRAPSQLVEFIVYSKDFRKPPTGFTMEPNTYMWFCSNDIPHEMCRIDDPEKEKTLRQWLTLAPKAAIWEYGVDFSNYFHVVSTFPSKVANIKFYGAEKLDGVMMQEVTGVRGGDMQRLRAWVFAKLLWNSQLDPYELAREYCEGVYGAASQEMLDYFNLVNEPCLRGRKTIEEYYGLESFLEKADALFQKGIRKASDDEYAMRELEIDYLPILISRLNVLFEQYTRLKDRFPVDEYRSVLENVSRIVKKYSIPKVSELTSMEGFLSSRQALLDLLNNKDGSFQVYAKNGRLYNYPEVSDALAEGGVATRLRCDGCWIVQWVLPTNLMKKNAPYQLEAEIRVEHESSLPQACCAGVYDSLNKKTILSVDVDGSRVASTEYRFLKLGKPFEITHEGEVYVYFTASAESDVKSFFVNRIRIVPVKQESLNP